MYTLSFPLPRRRHLLNDHSIPCEVAVDQPDVLETKVQSIARAEQCTATISHDDVGAACLLSGAQEGVLSAQASILRLIMQQRVCHLEAPRVAILVQPGRARSAIRDGVKTRLVDIHRQSGAHLSVLYSRFEDEPLWSTRTFAHPQHGSHYSTSSSASSRSLNRNARSLSGSLNGSMDSTRSFRLPPDLMVPIAPDGESAPPMTELEPERVVQIQVKGNDEEVQLAKVRLMVLLDELSGLKSDTIKLDYKLQPILAARQRMLIQQMEEQTGTNIYLSVPLTGVASQTGPIAPPMLAPNLNPYGLSPYQSPIPSGPPSPLPDFGYYGPPVPTAFPPHSPGVFGSAPSPSPTRLAPGFFRAQQLASPSLAPFPVNMAPSHPPPTMGTASPYTSYSPMPPYNTGYPPAQYAPYPISSPAQQPLVLPQMPAPAGASMDHRRTASARSAPALQAHPRSTLDSSPSPITRINQLPPGVLGPQQYGTHNVHPALHVHKGEQGQRGLADEVWLTGDQIGIDQAKRMLSDMSRQKIHQLVSRTVAMQPRKIDCILIDHLDALRQIMWDNATYIQMPLLGSGEQEVMVFGDHRISIERSIRRLYDLVSDLCDGTLSIPLLEHSEPYLSDFCARLGTLSIKHNVDIHANPDTIKVFGPSRGVRETVRVLSAEDFKTNDHEITFQLEMANDQREFIAGKKNGKTNKISKEANVRIRFDAINEYIFSLTLSGQAGPLSTITTTTAIGTQAGPHAGMDMLDSEMPAEISFHVPEAHHKRIIGVQGKTIQMIMKDLGVYVKFCNMVEHAQMGGYKDNEDNVLAKTPKKNAAALERLRTAVMELVLPRERSYEAELLIVPRQHYRILQHEKRLVMHDIARQTRTNITYPAKEGGANAIRLFGPAEGRLRAQELISHHIPHCAHIYVTATNALVQVTASPDFALFVAQVWNDHGVAVSLVPYEPNAVAWRFDCVRALRERLSTAKELLGGWLSARGMRVDGHTSADYHTTAPEAPLAFSQPQGRFRTRPASTADMKAIFESAPSSSTTTTSLPRSATSSYIGDFSSSYTDSPSVESLPTSASAAVIKADLWHHEPPGGSHAPAPVAPIIPLSIPSMNIPALTSSVSVPVGSTLVGRGRGPTHGRGISMAGPLAGLDNVTSGLSLLNINTLDGQPIRLDAFGRSVPPTDGGRLQRGMVQRPPGGSGRFSNVGTMSHGYTRSDTLPYSVVQRQAQGTDLPAGRTQSLDMTNLSYGAGRFEKRENGKG